MTPRDFCYWLQGYFELSKPANIVFGQQERDILEKHLQLVLRTIAENPNTHYRDTPRATAFCFMVCGMLSTWNGKTFSVSEIKTLAGQLDKVFEHELDAVSAPVELQDELNHLHGSSDPNGPVMRC